MTDKYNKLHMLVWNGEHYDGSLVYYVKINHPDRVEEFEAMAKGRVRNIAEQFQGLYSDPEVLGTAYITWRGTPHAHHLRISYEDALRFILRQECAEAIYPYYPEVAIDLLQREYDGRVACEESSIELGYALNSDLAPEPIKARLERLQNG